MTESEPPSFPTNSVAKEDLLYCRPDLEHEISSLDDSDIECIASKVGDLLQEDYWMALDLVLDRYLHVDKEDIEVDDTNNTSTLPLQR